jgi:hypothetical protein
LWTRIEHSYSICLETDGCFIKIIVPSLINSIFANDFNSRSFFSATASSHKECLGSRFVGEYSLPTKTIPKVQHYSRRLLNYSSNRDQLLILPVIWVPYSEIPYSYSLRDAGDNNCEDCSRNYCTHRQEDLFDDAKEI